MTTLMPIQGAQQEVQVEVPVLVGSGQARSLVCTTIPLPSPALEVKDIRKKVIIDSCTVIPDRVIIDGRLRKDLNFKTLTAGTVPPRPGVFTACSGIVNTASGAVLHTTVDVAFNLFITIPGARPGDTCTVLQAVVEGESEEPANVTTSGTFTTLVDKSLVLVCAKVTRPGVVTVAAPTAPVEPCPPAVTSGVPQSGNVVTFPGSTVPGPTVGTAVGPTIVFPGPQAPGR